MPLYNYITILTYNISSKITTVISCHIFIIMYCFHPHSDLEKDKYKSKQFLCYKYNFITNFIGKFNSIESHWISIELLSVTSQTRQIQSEVNLVTRRDYLPKYWALSPEHDDDDRAAAIIQQMEIFCLLHWGRRHRLASSLT